MKKHRLFSTLLQNQKSGYELIMTSVLIAVGVNLLSTGIVKLLGFEQKELVLIIIGAAICMGVIIRIMFSKIKELNQTAKIKGFVIYDEENHRIIKVPEYNICTDMIEYLNSACAENQALQKLWNGESIGRIKIVGGKPEKRAIGIATHSGALFVELLEYCVIHKLSLHLSAYFNNSYEKQRVRDFQRNDIPEVLLSNRFLKLFSEDMLNRAIFACQEGFTPDSNNDGGEIVFAQTSSGGLYDKFELTLPEKSKITRKNKNEIIIDTPILTLTLSCLFGGFGTVLKSGFYKYYLGIQHPQRGYRNYAFNVEVSVKFKVRSLFSKDKELYYAWIDSFLDEITSYIDKNAFFDKINWDSTYSLIRCYKNINEANKST